MIILKWFFKNMECIGFIWFTMNGGDVLEKLSDYQLLGQRLHPVALVSGSAGRVCTQGVAKITCT
jgi:hypothetical protein